MQSQFLIRRVRLTNTVFVANLYCFVIIFVNKASTPYNFVFRIKADPVLSLLSFIERLDLTLFNNTSPRSLPIAPVFPI